MLNVQQTVKAQVGAFTNLLASNELAAFGEFKAQALHMATGGLIFSHYVREVALRKGVGVATDWLKKTFADSQNGYRKENLKLCKAITWALQGGQTAEQIRAIGTGALIKAMQAANKAAKQAEEAAPVEPAAAVAAADTAEQEADQLGEPSVSAEVQTLAELADAVRFVVANAASLSADQRALLTSALAA